MSDIDELEELRARVDSLSAENTQLRDQQARRHRNEREHQQRVESACRRAWQDGRKANARLFVEEQVRVVRHGIDALLYVVANLPERPKRADLDRLKHAAELAQQVITLHATESPGDYDERVHSEVTQLRRYVTERGRSLHDEHATRIDDPTVAATDLGCNCPGCQLIVGMDATDTPDNTAPTTGTP